MKKKIKDLTLEELLNICNKNICSNCPLKDIACSMEFYIPVIEDIEINKEIEVEDYVD